MVFTLFYYLLKKYNFNNYLVSILISIPIYIILLNISELFNFYSVLIIGIDLFFFNNQINNQTSKQQFNQKKITKEFTNLANKYFKYLQNNNLKKNKKIIKNYTKTNLEIKDTLQHTLNNLN